MNNKTFATMMIVTFASQILGVLPTITMLMWCAFLVGFGNYMLSYQDNSLIIFRNLSAQKNANIMVMGGLVTLLAFGFKMINLLGIGSGILGFVLFVTVTSFSAGLINQVMVAKRSA